MNLSPFLLERYFARHEFTAKYLLSSSDCEAFTMSELLSMADDNTRTLWDQLSLGYTESLGHPMLRESIAEIYDGITRDDILVVVPEEGIFLLMHALLEPGDQVICTFPAFQPLYEIARSLGCELKMWEPEEGRGWHFSIDTLEEKLSDRTKLIIVNFPHNPTGYVPSNEDYQAIVRLAADRGIYLMSDEMFRFLEVEENSTLPSGCELYERAFSLFGLSKTFGLPGVRIGWIASKNDAISTSLADLRHYTTTCNSAPSEILALIALQNRAQIIGLQQARIRRNIALLDDFFRSHQEQFQWNRPRGGSMCFPRLRFAQAASRFCADLLRETGIMLASSELFDYGDRHIRIGFGRENLPEVLNLFARFVDSRDPA